VTLSPSNDPQTRVDVPAWRITRSEDILKTSSYRIGQKPKTSWKQEAISYAKFDLTIPTVKIASPNGSQTIWYSDSIGHKRPYLPNTRSPDESYRLEHIKTVAIDGSTRCENSPRNDKKKAKNVRFDEALSSHEGGPFHTGIPRRKPVNGMPANILRPQANQVGHRYDTKEQVIARKMLNEVRSDIPNRDPARSQAYKNATGADFETLMSLFWQLGTLVVDATSWVISMRPSLSAAHVRQGPIKAIEVRIPHIKQVFCLSLRLLFVVYVVFCVWRTLELLSELLALMFLPLRLATRFAKFVLANR